MIKVEIVYKDKKFESLKVRGHADSAPHGQDLVCAGVSAVLTGGFNNLEKESSFILKLDRGDAALIKTDEITSHDLTVIETIITSLKTIQESYPQYIKIEEKE